MTELHEGRLEYGKGEKGAERRRAPRIRKSFKLTCRVKTLPDEQTLIKNLEHLQEAETSDLSAVGISMWTDQLLVSGTMLEMEFPSPAGDKTITVHAKVVWSSPLTEGSHVRVRAGLEFLDMPPKARDKLLRLIKTD